jgi:hypothetical protein
MLLGVQMPKFLLTLMLFVFSFSVSAFAQRYDNFAGIPFGSDRQTVIEEVMKMGYEPYGQSGEGERVVIPVFKFGELPVQVDFIFNQNDKFYAFEIRTGRVEESRKNKAIEAASYMSEQFSLKYGEPAAPATVDENNLHNGRNIYQEWFSVKSLNAFTSVVKNNNRFFVVGVVEHRALAKEQGKKAKAKEKASNTPVF